MEGSNEDNAVIINSDNKHAYYRSTLTSTAKTKLLS